MKKELWISVAVFLVSSLVLGEGLTLRGHLSRKACDAGDVVACVELGNCYEKGLCGLKKDVDQAGRLYEKACVGNNLNGCARLGVCLYQGACGVRQQSNTPASSSRRACEGGNQMGCAHLGMCYQYGDCGFGKDPKRAGKLLQLSCNKGYLPGCTMWAFATWGTAAWPRTWPRPRTSIGRPATATSRSGVIISGSAS